MNGSRSSIYWVNVRTANPKGNIGDGGVIRRFTSDDAAKKYADSVNKTGIDTFVSENKAPETAPQVHAGDVFLRA